MLGAFAATFETASTDQVFSEVYRPDPSATRLAAQAKCGDADGGVFVLQGGWDDGTDATDDWVDLDFGVTVAAADTTTPLVDTTDGTHIFTEYAYYRVAFTPGSTDAYTSQVRITELG